MYKRMKTLILSVLLVLAITGCSSRDKSGATTSQASENSTSVQASSAVSESTTSQSVPDAVRSEDAPSATPDESISEADAPTASTGELVVHFGDDGTPFTMNLYDNTTAAAIADYVGTADWRLPINKFDGYDNWEVMQYYDLPSRYEIPSNAETVTDEKAGEVYYSEPNRIVLFYGDATVTGEYTKIGYFDATEEFVTAVRDNPVLEGWGNKIVLIKD